MIELKQLTSDEREIIAEYIFSYKTDILIKSDAEKVIDLFNSKGIDTSNVDLEAHSVFHLIKRHIDPTDRDEIMNLYYSGNL